MVCLKLDALVKSPIAVTPAEAGVQNPLKSLDSRFHGNDRKERFRTFYEIVKLDDLKTSALNLGKGWGSNERGCHGC
jgi:hypothetical protein